VWLNPGSTGYDMEMYNVKDERTPIGFSEWYGERKAKLLNADVSRKVHKEDQGRKRPRRTLYVLKEEFIESLNRELNEVAFY
jgi:hypothetical protein